MNRTQVLERLDRYVSDRSFEQANRFFSENAESGVTSRASAMFLHAGAVQNVKLLKHHFDGDVSVSEFELVLTAHDGARNTGYAMLRRQWKFDKIVDERFYVSGLDSHISLISRLQSIVPIETTVHKTGPAHITVELELPMNKHTHVWSLQEAKAKFSELLRIVEERGPQIITVHGTPKATITAYSDRAHSFPSNAALVKAFQACPAPNFEIPRIKSHGKHREPEF